MPYATPADLIARFGLAELAQLTDLVNIPPAVPDQARITLKLDDAQAFIDGYVGQRYRLPLRGCRVPPVNAGDEPTFSTPPVLKRLACDLARYYLHDDLAPENEVYRRFKAAVVELEGIADGSTLLACPWGGSAGDLITSDAQTGTQGETVYSFTPRAITDDTLRGFG